MNSTNLILKNKELNNKHEFELQKQQEDLNEKNKLKISKVINEIKQEDFKKWILNVFKFFINNKSYYY